MFISMWGGYHLSCIFSYLYYTSMSEWIFTNDVIGVLLEKKYEIGIITHDQNVCMITRNL